MKKAVITFMIVALLLACMTACADFRGDKNPPSSNNGGSNVPNEASTYELLAEMVDKDYSKIEIDIVTTTDFAELNSNYVLTQTNVAYTIEKLNLLPSDGNVTDLPSNYKRKIEGQARIENGKIVEFDGSNDVTLPSYDELNGNFNFDEDNFKNAVISDNFFKADVVSPSRFYGANVNMNNLKVTVKHNGKEISQISISYTTSNATVQTIYLFTK